jgi:hypothetical protein
VPSSLSDPEWYGHPIDRSLGRSAKIAPLGNSAAFGSAVCCFPASDGRWPKRHPLAWLPHIPRSGSGCRDGSPSGLSPVRSRPIWPAVYRALDAGDPVHDDARCKRNRVAYRPSPFAARKVIFGYFDLPVLSSLRTAPWAMWNKWSVWLLLLLVSGHVVMAIYHARTPGDRTAAAMSLWTPHSSRR